MIEYEVTIHIDAELADDYLGWLHGHIAQMLALPGFLGATVFRIADPAVPERVGYCARYRLSDDEALQTYLNEHAARMRADGLREFGERFAASRRILRPVSPHESTDP